MSSTKTKVDNVLHWRHRRTEPQPQATCLKNLLNYRTCSFCHMRAECVLVLLPRWALAFSALAFCACLVLPFWYWLTQVVLEKRPLNRCSSSSSQREKERERAEARDSEWQWHQLDHMQVCTSLQADNDANTPPLSFLQAECPSCRPTNSVTAHNTKRSNTK